MSGLIQTLLSTICCCDSPCWEYSTSYVTINTRRYKIRRLLSEKELSFTYMVELTHMNYSFIDNSNGIANNDRSVLFVLKQILCPFGSIDNVSNALREIQNYSYFDCPYIVKSVDSQVIQQKDGSKTVMIVLPFYSSGSLQDMINRNLLHGMWMAERQVIKLVIGGCRGLLCLHDPTTRETLDSRRSTDTVSVKYADEAALPLMLDDTPLEMNQLSAETSQSMKLEAYAHMNIKPSTILISKDDQPVITELGSCLKVPVTITNNTMLNEMKEWVDNHCALDYRAPELLDLKLNSVIDCSVDVWSLGCTLYMLLFGVTPFEREEQINGLSLKYNISKAQFSFPDDHNYSKKLLNIIISCLDIDPTMRPGINELLGQLQDI